MTDTSIWILGGYQSDFARNLAREGVDFAGLFAEVVPGTLEAAATPAADIGVIHVGNAFGEMFARQGHLGAMPATVVPELHGVPATRHEAACASGSVALLAAIADLRTGDHDCALVVGAELEKTVPGDDASGYLGAAAWVGHEGEDAKFVWPHMFSVVADEYDRRYGLDERYLHCIAELNFANARRNPNAQTRTWSVPDLAAEGARDEVNPLVDGRLRRFDCSQITDGGAGLVVVSDAYLKAHPGAKPVARIAGWGHRTAALDLAAKLSRAAGEPYIFPHLRRAVSDAFTRARTDLEGVHGLETHDCFTPSEYVAIDHIGLTDPGQSWRAIEDGDIAIGGRFPINPSGGLIGGGHPVGASGVRMVLDAAKQVAGTAGAYQVEGASRFATLNFGGSTATVVSFVVDAA
ncbi:thiolase domain-containing protein [Nocardia puris]|uniref:acetyl-CoA acetyltransferase n=1 Tax=Nocardia puris TaxID=208602 RepID=UPI001894CB03|nr:acetyl-CoA acetyltransferase [Nocardia puris]MBF6212597.1 thiolase domain-containing protein [Nocardia puris]MBF6369177.1 thiolase domain-containing protein [Nocardia puris]MBF6461186.1 thiolase domain-containing protein [Nocardia puris]